MVSTARELHPPNVSTAKGIYEEVDFPKSDTYALTITAQTFDIT